MIKTESNAAYHASEAMSKSRLWRMSVSPEWFRYCEENPPERTDALLFGSAFHKLVLEPEDFGREFVIAPQIDRRTKDGKTAWAAFVDASAGKDIVPHDMYNQAKEMADAVRASRLAGFLTRGEIEQSYYFTDELTGIPCKARPDCFKRIGERGVIVDLKSCQSAAPDKFRTDAVKYGYYMQAAMYKTAVEKEHGIECDFVFVAVEKTPPYLINVTQCKPEDIRYGEDLFREYIGMYKECTETGNWYGYNGAFGQINELGLPGWIAGQYE